MRVSLEDHDVRDVAASLHAVTSAKRDAHVVELHPGERLDRDFILRWRIDGSALRSGLLCADDADGRAGTFLLTLVPPSTQAVAAKPRDVVFVIDRSGSMEGWKMVAARRAAARMIDTLTSRDRFCAIAFDNAVDFIPASTLVDATDRHRFQAVEALAKVDARGGTELAEPLRLATRMLAGGTDDRERVIVLVTDGQVGNEDAILRELGVSLRNVRMFTLGIDQAVNAAFLRRLASAGGGLCELVESEDRLDAVMSKVHRRIGTPIATELALRGTGLDVEPASIAPRKLPDVYAGAPVTILGRYRNRAPAGAAIEIEGTSLGDPLRMKIVREPEASPMAWLAASWARAAIRDREDLYAAGARGGLEHEIIAISKAHSVLSRFTAFLAVDRSQVVNPGGNLQQVVQAVETPAGWDKGVARSGKLSRQEAKKDSSRMVGRAAGAMPPPPMPAMPYGAPPPMLGAPPAMPGAPMAPKPYGAPTAIPGMAPAMPMGGFGPPGGAVPNPSPMRGHPAPPLEGAPMVMPAPAEGALDLQGGGGLFRHVDVPLAEHDDDGADPFASIAQAAPDLAAANESMSMPPPVAAHMPVVAASPYLTKLAALARELDAQGRGRVDAAAIRLLRQRLTEWVEDARSVGGHAHVADAVERLIQRLSAALGLATDLATESVAVAAELARLASGTIPPPTKQSGRGAFWK
jgi:Ca-activated chloride channel family protein